MKRCRDCSEEKPLEDFPPSKKNRDGRGSYCRPCMRVRATASYRKRMAEQGRDLRERLDIPGHRRCPDCGQVLPLEEFPRNRRDALGRGRYCKPCHNQRGRDSLERAGGARGYHLKRRYGISAAEAAAIVEAQGGLCAICRERPAAHIDHDHATGAVRGALCFTCNVGLGNFRDREDLLLKAFDYLRGLPRHPPGGTAPDEWPLDIREPGPEPDWVAGRHG